MPSVFLAVPSRGELAGGTAFALLNCGSQHRTEVVINYSSLLTLNFNQLWCQALNKSPRPDYFAMIHDDVVPIGVGWLDALITILEAEKADVASAILPIKDVRGLTSTAFYHPETGRMQRVTMTEACEQLPVTFDGSANGDGWAVLPNTGLWVCRFGHWAEKICFEQRDQITMVDGQFTAKCFSEDWDFGVQCFNLGLRVVATRSVMAVHKGRSDFPNFTPWGAVATDTESVRWDPVQRLYRRLS